MMKIKYLAFFIFIMMVSCRKSDDIATPEPTNHSSPDNPTSVNINYNGEVVLGAPTDSSISVSIMSVPNSKVSVSYGVSKDNLNLNSSEVTTSSDGLAVIALTGLTKNSRYYYKINFANGTKSDVYTFITQRISGSTFTFGVQGDSHPERLNQMFSPDLYKINMQNVSGTIPDFYFALGDDFSIERLFTSNTVNLPNVEAVYKYQRPFLGMVGCNSSVFLVNGNHEQAAKYLLNGTANNAAVYAANSRKKFFPLPEPSGFYSGDTEPVNFVGYLKDYYAFEWGDALFVTIDPYWHSDNAVDNIAGTSTSNKDTWNATLGATQYNWLKQTLENSKAKYKFVFAHHVNGTGRGGVECANLYEWGGYSTNGQYDFTTKRSGWFAPLHQLFVKNKVTIFFQGHDHIFAKQSLDGVIYQSCPNPADNTYTAFNSDSYLSGDKLPNSGFVKVTVSSTGVKVDYVKAFLSGQGSNNSVAYTYTIN